MGEIMSTWRRLFFACASLLMACANAVAQGEGEQKALDQQIHSGVRDAINHGADLYNLHKDIPGCYRLYQGALVTVRPLLSHHADLQKTIDEALARVERLAGMEARAFELSKVLHQIRKRVEPGGKSLWARLGGEEAITKVIEDFVGMAAKDPAVDITRGGKFPIDEAGAKRIKKLLLEMISQESDGPYKYTGKNLKEVHKGMGITDAEFNAVAGHLKHALEMHKANPADIDLVLKAIGATRADVVEPKKSDDKKGNGAKPPVETAKVTGKVTLKGMPLESGFITLVSTSGRQFSASLVKDGTFEFKKGVAPGEYRVIFENSVVPVLDKDGQFVKEKAVPSPVIPAKYQNPETSPIRLNLVVGANEVNLDLP